MGGQKRDLEGFDKRSDGNVIVALCRVGQLSDGCSPHILIPVGGERLRFVRAFQRVSTQVCYPDRHKSGKHQRR